MKLQAIAELIGGRVHGDVELEISGVTGIAEAGPTDITYVNDASYLAVLRASTCGAVIVRQLIDGLNKAQITADNPRLAYAKLLEHFYVKPRPALGVSPQAYVAPDAVLGADVTLYPNVYVSVGARIGAGSTLLPGVFIGEGSVLGEYCTIHPNAVIREGVTLGDRVIVHAGAVIGGDGFGYVFTGHDLYKIPHVGGVVIEDDVEIGCNACIDRGTTGNTVIGRSAKLDNLVQVAHNVRVGRCSALVSQVGVAGSSVIGDFVLLGGQVGVADHAEIASGSVIGARSGVMGKLAAGEYAGAPAMPRRDWLRSVALIARLPELKKRLEALEAKLAALVQPRPLDTDAD